MTNAILPLNVKALRVNLNDQQGTTLKFKGRVAAFEQMPFQPNGTIPSTGSAIVQPLGSTATAIEPLKAGMHVHWELPDVYRRGTQAAAGGEAIFPHAPNTWLVSRHLQIWDTSRKTYGPLQSRGWIVESDYIADKLQPDGNGVLRPAIPVPLPTHPNVGEVPFKFMGRVVDYDQWQGPATPDHYLPHYAPHYLTSVGFVGPSFNSYYPECSSVFGFWDHFKDVPQVYDAIQNNLAIQFRASYQVLGWVRDAKHDVLVGFGKKVTDAYNAYVTASIKAKSTISATPATELVRIAKQDYRLHFNAEDIVYTLDDNKYLVSLDAPVQGLCNGWVQEVVWNMLSSPGSTYFLSNPSGPQPNAVWTDDKIRLAVGNTTVEALSALIKDDILNPGATRQQISDYEVLLNALQLGLLQDLETNGNALITLEEALHTRSFTKNFGGYVWAVEPKEEPGRPVNKAPKGSRGITLPLDIAERLTTLNRAQKAYDQGRAALDEMRKQLFMDWLRFIEAYVDPAGRKLHIDPNLLSAFIDVEGPACELGYIVARSADIGVQSYVVDRESGLITGLNPPAQTTSAAGQVWRAYEALVAALKSHKEWEIRATPGPAFWTPTDPVLVMEGDRLEPVRRNGTGPTTPVRLSAEILSQLDLTYQGGTIKQPVSTIPGRPVINAETPMRDDIAACVGEIFLLVPMLAEKVADAVAQDKAQDNPAKANRADFITTLRTAQGGFSPLDAKPSDTGLFARLHAAGAEPLKNPVEAVAHPQDIRFTFTNPAATGWTCAPPGWGTQTLLPEFDAKRVDPFLPVFLIWSGTLDPLKRDNGLDYSPTNLSAHFELDENAVDYTYPVPGSGQPAPFTTGTPVTYNGAVVLSRQPTRSLTAQIEQYLKLYPHDAMKAKLDEARAAYAKAQIMSQGIGDFNLQQILRRPIARVPVEDLVNGDREFITSNIAQAATATAGDSWYAMAFNSSSPIAKDLLAQNNFGALRAGFGQIRDLEIIDAFGQRMTLQTTIVRPDGSQNAVPSHNLAPAHGDKAHAQDIFYPPRLLPPSRLWFKWLSAAFDSTVPGFTDDFVEMNAHPATSPVCGWVLPNHLDVSLFFYDADGRPFGSFGVEHDALVYRTRAGNTANPRDDLAKDIGPESGPPLPGVNRHVFDVMWHVHRQSAGFLKVLMATISSAAGLMNPARFAQEVSLSVLMGQPLALTRAVLALETAGGVLPVSQADISVNAAFSQDVLAGRYRYPDRQKASAAALDSVGVPLRLGNIADIDDGLVGFFIDGQGTKGPYGIFYAPTAPARSGKEIARPGPDTITLTLNAAPIAVTFLMDPRSPIHATTGILPVETLGIPSDQYAQDMGRLELTFFTHPILRGHGGLTVPLPEEAGYAWSWVQPGMPAPIPLDANAGNEIAVYNYTPQHLFEGWARLAKSKKPGSE